MCWIIDPPNPLNEEPQRSISSIEYTCGKVEVVQMVSSLLLWLYTSKEN